MSESQPSLFLGCLASEVSQAPLPWRRSPSRAVALWPAVHRPGAICQGKKKKSSAKCNHMERGWRVYGLDGGHGYSNWRNKRA